MKKLLSLVLSLLLVLQAGVPALGAVTIEPDFKVYSDHIYLYNLTTEQVVYESEASRANQKTYPASLTKIMTCILALESVPYDQLESTILTYPTYVQEYLFNYQKNLGSNISLAGLMAGEQMNLKELLYGLMVRSGNEIAMIIADYLGEGTGLERQASFVQKMNQRAKELGATGTNFANPHGLHDANNYTTARDMALLARHALNLTGFSEFCNQPSYTAGPTNKNDQLVWTSTNHMIRKDSPDYYYQYVSNVKTGTLPESGRCLITTATRDGFTYLLVLMGAPYMDDETKEIYSQRYDYLDTKNIYEWAFRNFKVKILVEKAKIVHDIPLRLSSAQDYIQLATADRFTALVNVDVDPASSVQMRFDVPESVDAPVKKGDPVGYVDLVLYNEVVGRVALVAFESVDASPMLVLWEQVKAVLGSFWFKFGLIFFLLLVTLYIGLMILRNRNRRRNGYKRRRRM